MPPDPTPYRARRRVLAQSIADRGLALGVVTTAESVTYYSGNEIGGSNALVVSADGTATVVCDAYDEYNFAAADPRLDLMSYPYTRPLWAALAELVAKADGTIGLEMSGLSATAWRGLTQTIPPAGAVRLDDTIAAQRVVKDDTEIGLLRAAGAITTRAIQTVRELLAGEPVTEATLAAATYTQVIQGGGDHLASQPYIKSGPRALHTHARWSQRRIDLSDHVLVELAASVHRYHAPIMRTRLAARDDRDYRATVEAVAAGRNTYLRGLRPGVTAAELHAMHEATLAEHGMRDRNRHAGGYSLGIAFAPTWGETDLLIVGPAADTPLRPRMALHLISGLTDPAAGIPHIGLSECVLVTDAGYERLVDAPDFL